MEPAAVFFNIDNHRHAEPTQYRQKKCVLQNVLPDTKPPSMAAVGADKGSSSSSSSNLLRFLDYTTPRLPAQFLPKTQSRSVCSQGSGSIRCAQGFFSLNDLWESFEEWSAYGAGVPILLGRQETVMQYYVPYLSGIQLYSRSGNELTQTTCRRRLGEDSDGSEVDYRDSNSETSSCDGELDRMSDRAWWSSSGEGEREHGGSETLIFEYFESAAPSLRVPLADKIKDLAGCFAGLRNLCSNDISRSSWLSVAWYPIYRIPMGPTLKDLAASFLTYHSISTQLTDEYSNLSCYLHTWHGDEVAVHPFGMAGYKFCGRVWVSAGAGDLQRADVLRRSSDAWLKRLFVRHPDFEYFKAHCVPVHRRS